MASTRDLRGLAWALLAGGLLLLPLALGAAAAATPPQGPALAEGGGEQASPTAAPEGKADEKAEEKSPAERKKEEKAAKKAAEEEKARQKRLQQAREEEAKQAGKEEEQQAKQSKKKASKKKETKSYATTAERKKYASREVADLLKEAQSLLAAEKWLKAQEILLVLEDNERAREIQGEVKLALADSYFGLGGSLNWVEALSRYRTFQTFYPNDPRGDYAQYKIGMCHYLQVPKSDRDQSPTRNALFEFQKLLELFPGSEWADEAEERIRNCRASLGDHDFEVGRYYFVRDQWAAASTRFQSLVKEFPDYPGRAEVYWHLAECAYKLGSREEGDLYKQLYEESGGRRAVEAPRAKGKPQKVEKERAKAEKKEQERLEKEARAAGTPKAEPEPKPEPKAEPEQAAPAAQPQEQDAKEKGEKKKEKVEIGRKKPDTKKKAEEPKPPEEEPKPSQEEPEKK